MTENMAVFAPMPRVSVSTATTVKPGLFASIRTAKRTSWISAPMIRLPARLPAYRPPFPTSLVAERDQWVHMRRSPRGKQAGSQAHDCENHYDAHERPRVGSRHTINLACHQARQGKT